MSSNHQGYCLAELLVTLLLLGLMFSIGAVSLVSILHLGTARASVQSLQAACAWAQVDVVLHGGVAEVSMGASTAVQHDLGVVGGSLIGLPGSVPLATNVSRWRMPDGLALRFLGPFGSPDTGGSVFVESLSGSHRVAIRPVSGLAIRSWSDE